MKIIPIFVPSESSYMEDILSIIIIVFFALLVIMKINAKKASRNVLP